MRKKKRLLTISAYVLVVSLAIGTWAFFHWLGFMLRRPMPVDKKYDWPMKVVAGKPVSGFTDGSSPRFNKPIRLAPFGPETILVADINNHAIRVVHLDGRTETIAGGPEKQGYLDGPAEEARFDSPHGIAVREDGVIAVAEAANNTIRLLIPKKKNDGEGVLRYSVTTLAGKAGKKGFLDGLANKALFNAPHSVVWGKNGELFVADIGNSRLRKIQNGEVTTVAGTGGFGHKDGPLGTGSLQYPMDITIDLEGNVLIGDAGTGMIRGYSPESGLFTPYTDIVLDMPHGLDVATDGRVVVAEMNAHRVVLLTADGKIIRLCGTGERGAHQNQLNKPASVLIHSGYVWIADLKNHRIMATKWLKEKSVTSGK